MARVRVTKIDNPRAVGKRLRDKRLERGLTLRELAFSGCTAPYISAIEHGRRVPSLQILAELARRLNTTPEYLAAGETHSVEAQVVDAELTMHLGDLDEAAHKFTSLREGADGALKLRCVGGLGVIAARRGNLSDAVSLLEEAQVHSPANFLTSTTFVETLGRSYATRGQYDQAIALFEDARAAATERGDRPASLKATVLLANTYIDAGDVARSADVLAAAAKDIAELNDPMLRATLLWSQARLHTVESRHDLAAEFAARALETLRANEDDRAVALAHQLLAYIEIERGNAEAAMALLDTALPIVVRSADAIEAAVFELDRARALMAGGHLEEAQEVVQRIAPVLRDGPAGDGGRYYILLAEIYEALGDSESALSMYDLAVERLSGHRSPHLVRAHRGRGSLLEQLGRTDEALAALRSALDIQTAEAPSSERSGNSKPH